MGVSSSGGIHNEVLAVAVCVDVVVMSWGCPLLCLCKFFVLLKYMSWMSHLYSSWLVNVFLGGGGLFHL